MCPKNKYMNVYDSNSCKGPNHGGKGDMTKNRYSVVNKRNYSYMMEYYMEVGAPYYTYKH